MRKLIIGSAYLLSVMAIILGCQNASEIEMAKFMSNGKDIYTAKCQNCHGKNGEGLAALAPPLTDTLFLLKNKSQLAGYIKNGVSHPMQINGKTYHEKMPAFPELHDIDIAQVIVYITNTFGNKQGSYSHQQVAADLIKSK